MQKIVINAKHGGFGLSHRAIERYAELSGFEVYHYVTSKHAFRDGHNEWRRLERHERDDSHFCVFTLKRDLGPTTTDLCRDKEDWFSDSDLSRNDPLLIQVVEEMGSAANGSCADLEIVEIPDGVKWQIEEYDGLEWVAEAHRTWR